MQKLHMQRVTATPAQRQPPRLRMELHAEPRPPTASEQLALRLSGHLDARLWQALLGFIFRKLGLTPSEAEMEEMVNAWDYDGSGTIDFEEFCGMMLSAERSNSLPDWLQVPRAAHRPRLRPSTPARHPARPLPFGRRSARARCGAAASPAPHGRTRTRATPDAAAAAAAAAASAACFACVCRRCATRSSSI